MLNGIRSAFKAICAPIQMMSFSEKGLAYLSKTMLNLAKRFSAEMAWLQLKEGGCCGERGSFPNNFFLLRMLQSE